MAIVINKPPVKEYLQAKCKQLQDELCMLKPHVMTQEEIEQHLDTVIWLETPDCENLSKQFVLVDSYSLKHGIVTFRFIEDYEHVCTYSLSRNEITWRAWNIRPQEWQRNAVAWKDD